MNVGFGDIFTEAKSYVSTGGAIAMSAHTRASSAPTVIAMYEPKEKPAAHISTAGYWEAVKATAAL